MLVLVLVLVLIARVLVALVLVITEPGRDSLLVAQQTVCLLLGLSFLLKEEKQLWFG
jgi:hypothetical protein